MEDPPLLPTINLARGGLSLLPFLNPSSVMVSSGSGSRVPSPAGSAADGCSAAAGRGFLPPFPLLGRVSSRSRPCTSGAILRAGRVGAQPRDCFNGLVWRLGSPAARCWSGRALQPFLPPDQSLFRKTTAPCRFCATPGPPRKGPSPALASPCCPQG